MNEAFRMLTNKIKAQMVLVATFFLGMVIGATGFYLYSRKHGTGSANDPQALLNDMSRSLELTMEQRVSVEEIMNQSRLEYQELRNQNRPLFNSVRDRTRQRIRGVLSAEQQARYDEWNRIQDEKREQQRAR